MKNPLPDGAVRVAAKLAGGVSPVAHTTSPVILIDAKLFRFTEVWAAAGHPHAVFPLSADELVQLTGAPVTEVT